MASKEEEQLPEEKLLKVIQGDGKAKSSGSSGAAAAVAKEPATGSAPVAASSPKPEPAASAAAEAKPALKVIRAEERPADGPVAERHSAARSPAPAKTEQVALASPPRRGFVFRFSLQNVNRALGVATAVMFCFTALEIWANVQRSTRQAPGSGEAAAALIAESGTVSGLGGDAVTNEIVLFPVRADATAAVTVTTTTTVLPDWGAYVKENVSLIGLSRATSGEPEAILFDKKEGRNYFLTLGQRVTLAERDLKLEAVDGEEAALSDGRQTLKVRPKGVKSEGAAKYGP
jgi:hypothetical protein